MAKYIKLLVGPVLAGAFLATGYIAARAAESNVAVMARVKGVSFDVGSKRAVTYYKPAGGICNLTLLLAERAGDDVVPASASRVTCRAAGQERACRHRRGQESGVRLQGGCHRDVGDDPGPCGLVALELSDATLTAETTKPQRPLSCREHEEG